MDREINIEIIMEHHLIWVKVLIFALFDAIMTSNDSLAQLNEMLRFIFYAMGIFVLTTSAYEWNKQRVNYNKWKDSDFDPKVKEKLNIK